MLADDLGLHRARIHAEPLAEVKLKAQRIEQRAAAEHAVVPRDAPGHVGKRIGRVGDGEQERFGRCGDDRGHDIAVDRGIGAEQLQSARGVAAIGGAACFFVGAGGDHHHRRAAQIGVIAGPQRNGGREHAAVLQIGDGTLGPPAVAVDEDDLARRAAQRHRKHARGSDCPRADDADFHSVILFLPRITRSADNDCGTCIARRGGSHARGRCRAHRRHVRAAAMREQ